MKNLIERKKRVRCHEKLGKSKALNAFFILSKKINK